ncbi:protocadherin beta-15 [Eucyclogobius newberryi]|uniref:protocadherin beta-15 n=1 Tax=Eucyclogobius newberryi TaxID=166745 RepID=UPI003B596352
MINTQPQKRQSSELVNCRTVLIFVCRQHTNILLTMDQREHLFWLLGLLFTASSGEVRYTLPEELQSGYVIGNVARDLGLRVMDLRARGAHVVSDGTVRLFEMDIASGNLKISQRIDREELCAQASVCTLHYQLLLEDPLQAHSLVLDIDDVNDNSPVYATEEIKLDILESSNIGRRFPLESAQDPDFGTNSVRGYKLTPNEHFTLEHSTQINGVMYPELVLKKMLDYETQREHVLKINAIDGGNPARSGTASILVRVLDANDNVPVFTQRVYKVSVPENSPMGTVIVRLNATDADDGLYGTITYSFRHTIGELFEINHENGEVLVAGVIDFEEANSYELDVQAKDGGGQTSHCKLKIDIIDINDNEPVVEIKSASANVLEDCSSGTMVALINVYDLDTGPSGHVTCVITENVPFKLVSDVKNYFMLVTDGVLDREMQAQYNITISATDGGSPALSSFKILTVTVSDINDNSPTFTQTNFIASVLENEPVNTYVLSVKAEDPDASSNSKIQYQISKHINTEDASFFTINSETGKLSTARPFDYESSVHYQIVIIAQDGGKPPLSSSCTVNVFVQDQNDNAPVVLYPVQSGGFLAEELVPVDAPRGYLVTKVVAVDGDLGHNAWLSYRIITATDPHLFSIGLHTGEIRTVRIFMESDEPKHSLVILVNDNGLKTLSVTCTINIGIASGLPVLNELLEFNAESQNSYNLTLYLIVALSIISCLFILFIGVFFYAQLCKRSYIHRSNSRSLPVFPTTYCPPSFAEFSHCGTLLNDERFDPFLTTGSWRGDFRFSSSTDTDTLKNRSAAYQKSTLRRISVDRPAIARAGAQHPFYVVT